MNTGLNYNYDYVYQDGYAHRLYRAGDRYYNYDENGNISIERQGEDFEAEYDIRQEIVGYQENGEPIYRMNFAVGTEVTYLLTKRNVHI